MGFDFQASAVYFCGLFFGLLQNTCCLSIYTYCIEVSHLVIHLRFYIDKLRLRVFENRVLRRMLEP